MIDYAYLIFNRKGIVEMRVGQRRRKGLVGKRPALASGEYAVLIAIDVPDKYFETRPVPRAILEIPADKIIDPPVEVRIETPPSAVPLEQP